MVERPARKKRSSHFRGVGKSCEKCSVNERNLRSHTTDHTCIHGLIELLQTVSSGCQRKLCQCTFVWVRLYALKSGIFVVVRKRPERPGSMDQDNIPFWSEAILRWWNSMWSTAGSTSAFSPDHTSSAVGLGCLVSYRIGACRIMPILPTTHAVVKIQRNNRSSTMATYFQSSFTCKKARLLLSEREKIRHIACEDANDERQCMLLMI